MYYVLPQFHTVCFPAYVPPGLKHPFGSCFHTESGYFCVCQTWYHGYNCNLGEFIQIDTDSISCIATSPTRRDVMLVIMYVIIEIKEQHAQMIGHHKMSTGSNLEWYSVLRNDSVPRMTYSETMRYDSSKYRIKTQLNACCEIIHYIVKLDVIQCTVIEVKLSNIGVLRQLSVSSQIDYSLCCEKS